MEKRAEELFMGNNEETQWFAIIVAVFAVILSIVLFAFWQRRKSTSRSVLITGLCDAGKTLLYARLLHSKFIETYTSAKENIGDIEVKDKILRIVDIPGHERMRYKFFDKYKSSARAIIFMVDSVSVQKDIRDVAEYLYTLLSDNVMKSSIPVLILCNKQDQTMAKGCAVIKTMLEKEINLVRVTKASQLESTDATSTSIFLGKQGKDFEFAHLNTPIEFAECSAFNKDSETSADIEQIETWLKKIV